MSLIFRGGVWHLKRRVPTRFAAVEPRPVIWVSLRTDSRAEAEAKAAAVWAQMLEAWSARLAGASADAATRFDGARRLAALRGVRYLPAEDVAKLPVEEILQRIEAIPERDGRADPVEAAALLGTARPPGLTLSGALDAYWTLARDKTLGKSPDQIRRWRNPYLKAFRNLIDVVGDTEVAKLTADDMQDFRDWWLDRIEAENLTPNSANKDFSHIATALRLVAKRKRLGTEPPVGGLAIRGGAGRRRLPFSTEWIRDRILAPGALDRLNTEARSIVLVMVNTGARPSEIAALRPEDVVTDAEVPHIRIRAAGRQLKTETSERDIPLVGVSLRAVLPGYPRYRDNPGLSATVNKFLRSHGLAETPGHTLYGLRHSFEDRMLAAGVDERIRRDLMGHSLGGRQRYGRGASLEHLARCIASISL